MGVSHYLNYAEEHLKFTQTPSTKYSLIEIEVIRWSFAVHVQHTVVNQRRSV